MRILRQADQWLLGADDEDDTAAKTDPAPKGPPPGTEHMLKGPSIPAGLNNLPRVAPISGDGPGPEDSLGWSTELPGDKILDTVDQLKERVHQVLPDSLLSKFHPK